MIFNIIAFAVVAYMAYHWSRYGALAALLHLLCTLVAGAIAFAVWEPLALTLLGIVPPAGTAQLFENLAWPASLLVPFGAGILILRAIVDAAVPDTIKNPAAVDMVGGAAFGAVSAYLAVGVLAIGFGFLRTSGVLGYLPVRTDARGLVEQGYLWIQADRAAEMTFSHLSKTSLRSQTPLADAYPSLLAAGYAQQASFGAAGNARTVLRPEDFSVNQAYVIGDAAGIAAAELFDFPEANRTPFVGVDGERPPRGRLFGYVVTFESAARESFGQVTMRSGQAVLVARRGSRSVSVFPHAVISPVDPDNGTGLQRWPVVKADDIYPSVGGASQAVMGFEFLVPAGFEPVSLSLKNTRVAVDRMEPRSFAGGSALVSAIASGSLGGGTATIEDVDRSDAQTVRGGGSPGRRSADSSDTGVVVSDNLGFTIQITQRQGLELNGDNQVTRGEAAWRAEDLPSNNAVNRDLRVDKFATIADSQMVQIDVSPGRAASILGRAYQTAQQVVPPQLIDTNGTPYQAVGYVFRDENQVRVRLSPGNPIRGLTELPQISRVARDQSLTLLFYVTDGVEIETYALGSRAVLDFDPPLEID